MILITKGARISMATWWLTCKINWGILDVLSRETNELSQTLFPCRHLNNNEGKRSYHDDNIGYMLSYDRHLKEVKVRTT